jgi:tRNA(Arg) A34 adenosine deaminase TadA
MMTDQTSRLMARALELAREALASGDHPYGSVIVGARAELGELGERNRVVSTTDPTAHSETMTVRAAARLWGLDGLAGSTLVTSYEPCPMCLGAILEAGVARLVIGVRRPVGAAPLGDYTVEALLGLLGRAEDLKVEEFPVTEELAAFYASVA